MASIIKGVSILLANQYNLQSHLRDIIVREEDASGNFRTTDNGTRYVLRKINLHDCRAANGSMPIEAEQFQQL